MGFLNGRVTFSRYRITGDSPLPFGDEILELARKHAIGSHSSPDSAEGISTGWAGGDHILDLELKHGKNLLNDAFHMAIRVDTDKIPSSLLRAYTQIEINARAQQNPSGFATKAQKEEAKEAALARAKAEAADGRFRRRNHYPILWDGLNGILYAGSNSSSVLERIQGLFRETFDRTLEPITSGTMSRTRIDAEPAREASSVDVLPLSLVSPTSAANPFVAWSGEDSHNLDYLGNEFLVWVWHSLQADGDSITLPDGSQVTAMLTKTLTLDCPRGETGRDQLTDEAPTRLPEAFRALQAGKLPRKVGMILVRQGAQYELTIQAETLAVSGANLPKPDDTGLSAHDQKMARIDSLRHLSETLDLLFETFVTRRTALNWSEELGRIRQWLQAA